MKIQATHRRPTEALPDLCSARPRLQRSRKNCAVAPVPFLGVTAFESLRESGTIMCILYTKSDFTLNLVVLRDYKINEMSVFGVA
jgi:hypothetical protein